MKNKTLNISSVELYLVSFSWLSLVVRDSNITDIIISEEQSRYLFSNGEDRWTHYRGCLLKIK